MIKCFWCGAENKKHQDVCCVCRRKLQWTNFFKSMLRPSVGSFLGSEPTERRPEAPVGLRLA